MTKFGNPSSLALRLFCAMLLVALGFAHRPASAMPLNGSAYMLPDGSFPTICIPESGDSQPGKEMGQRCEACRIAATVTLPSPPCESAEIAPLSERASFAFIPERFHRLNFPPNAPPRGPPALPASFLAT